ncbi:MAG: hypothetical protein J6U54_03925 [Clostridiales bacterium]|nr:hypothetical protein [Clostridiales bacterium]
MGLWSGLKTLGSEIVSGAKDVAIGARRLKDAGWKALGVYDRNLEGKTLMRFGNEAEARWVTPFKPTSRKVMAGIDYTSTENLSNAASGAWDSVATAAEETAALSSKNTSELLGAVSGDYSLINGIEEAIAKETPKVAAEYKTYAKAAKRNGRFGNLGKAPIKQNTQELDSAVSKMKNRANMTGSEAYATTADKTSLSSEKQMLRANEGSSDYWDYDPDEFIPKKAPIEGAGVTATGTTQPAQVAAANNNMGAKAQAASEVKRTEAVTTQQGIQAEVPSGGQVEAAAQTEKALETTKDIPVSNTKGSKDMSTAIKYLGANTAVIAGINATHGSQSNAVLYGQQALGV